MQGGMWKSFVEDILEPKLDPRRLLMRAVAKRVNQITSAGSGRYSYRRPSRRPSLGGLIRPRSFACIPKITVVIDTSGSMGHEQLALSVGLVSRVLNGLHIRDGVRVLCGDTSAKWAETVFDPSKIELAGRGGTDMTRVITQAAEEEGEHKPDLVVCCTDGYTDWPREKLDVPVVACLTTAKEKLSGWCAVPDWITSIYLEA